MLPTEPPGELDPVDCPHPVRIIAGQRIALAPDQLYRAERCQAGVAVRRWSWGSRDWTDVPVTWIPCTPADAERFVLEFNEPGGGERRW